MSAIVTEGRSGLDSMLSLLKDAVIVFTAILLICFALTGFNGWW